MTPKIDWRFPDLLSPNGVAVLEQQLDKVFNDLEGEALTAEQQRILNGAYEAQAWLLQYKQGGAL